MTSLAKLEMSTLAKVLYLVGGLLLVVGGLFRVIDVNALTDLTPTIRSIASLTGVATGIFAMVVGAIALLGTQQVKSPAWNIVLLILGLIVSSLGGVLVFVGSIIGLVSIYVKA